MALTSFLLDSVILIDQLNGHPQALRFIEENHSKCLVSPVTRTEVLAGSLKHGPGLAQRLLDLFPCLTIDADIGDLAGSLRREQRWKTPDALQMALARTHGCLLVTRNTKDFHPDRHASVLIPYQI